MTNKLRIIIASAYSMRLRSTEIQVLLFEPSQNTDSAQSDTVADRWISNKCV